MYGLTQMSYSRNFHETVQDVFGGIDRRPAARDGAIADMMNMCAEAYPALTVRPRRGHRTTVAEPNGLFCRDCVSWVDGGKLVVDGEIVAELADGAKLMTGIQEKICIWPDKVIYDRETGALTQMELDWQGEVIFSDGTYAGEPAAANTIVIKGDQTGLFRAGDGVTVAVVADEYVHEAEGAFVIQEVEYDSKANETELRFLEDTWLKHMPPGYEADTAADDGEMIPFPNPGMKTTVRIQRRTPELEGVFEHHNRLWGWHGGTIRCCRLGDPTNWESFNGDATDSWELVTGSAGDITGGVSYAGRPVFFKENRIIRLYGDYPGQFSTSETESLGVEAGSGRSLAIAGDMLFYKSPQGIMAYTGGNPWHIGEELGPERYRDAVAGSDGVRYYVSMVREDGESEILCYDTRHRVWHREDGMKLVGLGWHADLYALEERGELWVLGDRRDTGNGEEGVASWVETADYYDGTTRKKTPGRLVLRLEIDDGVDLDIKIRYDSRGDWELLRRLTGEMVKGQEEIVVALRRCDHYRIRLEGLGLGGRRWTLHALTRERAVGSNRK